MFRYGVLRLSVTVGCYGVLVFVFGDANVRVVSPVPVGCARQRCLALTLEITRAEKQQESGKNHWIKCVQEADTRIHMDK